MVSVILQLLTELDGLEVRKDVYVVAATNRSVSCDVLHLSDLVTRYCIGAVTRLELIDDAMLRPGRLGKLLYVPLPSLDDRISILTALTRLVQYYYDAYGDCDDANVSACHTSSSSSS